MPRTRINVYNRRNKDVTKVHVHHWQGADLTSSDRGDWDVIRPSESNRDAKPTTASAVSPENYPPGAYAGARLEPGTHTNWFIRFETEGEIWQTDYFQLRLKTIDADLIFSISNLEGGPSESERYIQVIVEADSISRFGVKAYPVNTAHRPIYLIAHMCNVLEEIRQATDMGANAIECDITYSEDRKEWIVYHSPGSESNAPTVEDWLAEAKRVANDNLDYFTTIILDTKTPERYGVRNKDYLYPYQWGRTEADLTGAVRKYFGDSDVNIIFSTSALEKADYFKEIIPDLWMSGDEAIKPSRWGIAIDENPEPTSVIRKLNELFEEKLPRQPTKFWYGNGIDWRLPERIDDVASSMEKARNCRREQILVKFYDWTYSSVESVRVQIFDRNVDGVMVHNDIISDARKMIVSADNKSVRLATRKDAPFVRHPD